MPPRPPPQPRTLTILMMVAALAATWLTAAMDQVLRGIVGRALGVPWLSMALDPARGWTPVVTQGPAPALTVGGVAAIALAGAVVVPLLAIGLRAVTSAVRSAGWLRGFALAWLVVAILWVPTSLVAAAAPGSHGPVAELYTRLGDPQAGRRAAVVLAAALLALVAGPVSRTAVAVGRSWMRADAIEFRRRLVRVVAGWPGLAAAAAILWTLDWARTPWLAPWPLAVLAALHLRTR